jgi:AcrR family transcriptional regulator
VAKSIPPERVEQVVRAATRVFAERGFRRTQVADIAASLGMSVGSVYTYAQSKEALFHACLVSASPAGESLGLELPLLTPTPSESEAVIRRGLEAIRSGSVLDAALHLDAPDDVAAELGGIIGDFYDRTARSRQFQALMETSARDLPHLFDAFFVDMRRPALDHLATYLASRIASGHLRPVPDVATTARLVNETQAWFARHRHGDQDADDINDALARSTVIDVLVAGLLPR